MTVLTTDLPWITRASTNEMLAAFNNTHALLINGLQAIGKSQQASKVCQALLKQSSSDQAEQLIRAGTHPDLHVLTSAYSHHQLDASLQNSALRYLDADALEKKRLSRQISVDSIRSLVSSMSESPALGGYKLALIYPAEDMNKNSANALLKFLEEPTNKTLIILISHDISKLAATIRSRCMRINISTPSIEISKSWLKQNHAGVVESEIDKVLLLASNRPLLASQYLLDGQQKIVDDLLTDVEQLVSSNSLNVITTAKKWMKIKQTDFILNWLCLLFGDVIKIKSSACRSTQLAAYNNNLVNIAKQLSITKLFYIYDYFLSTNQRYDGVTDEALLLEDLILTMTKASTSND